VWLTIAGFSASDARKRRAATAVNRADVWFTIPGVLLLLANGLAMAIGRYGGFPSFLGVDFIVAGLVLLSATGLVWASRLVPAQLELYRLGSATDLDTDRFRAVLRRWYAWGTLATVLPIAAVIVMAMKPSLW
jgi:hypothetical protein